MMIGVPDGTEPVAATSDAYFDQAWAKSDDPWDHAGRFYETRKYDATVALLDRERFVRAFEPGCGIGLLTERLAKRCDVVEARDLHHRAVNATRTRCIDFPGVNVQVGAIPGDWPLGRFDLIVLSELLYYLDSEQLTAVRNRTAEAAVPGALLVLVHYRRPVLDHAIGGDAANEIFANDDLWTPRGSYIDDDFRLDLAVRADD
jgi:SAM-dependent methyltransferase